MSCHTASFYRSGILHPDRVSMTKEMAVSRPRHWSPDRVYHIIRESCRPRDCRRDSDPAIIPLPASMLAGALRGGDAGSKMTGPSHKSQDTIMYTEPVLNLCEPLFLICKVEIKYSPHMVALRIRSDKLCKAGFGQPLSRRTGVCQCPQRRLAISNRGDYGSCRQKPIIKF